ncbi:MAG: ArsA family ATPase [Proteobacteria bacterium]|nr:ArsA family ATPase [Cystobacterineae bacterium]MCL2259566.1 ArsA family ATPase [Cystobacterineae bacterium]MCL2313952.1 ArsA family ATPase [Pseudomonadota bacterium]
MSALSPKRLLFVSGKGGVGKSSVAASLALLYSQANAKTLLVEMNAPNHLASLLGHPPPPSQPALSEPNLWMVNLQFRSALKEYALMVLKYEPLYRAVFENRWAQQLLDFIPSLQELVLLGKLLFHSREKTPNGQYRFDKIIVDAPATGHVTRLLAIPSVLLHTVPPGTLSQEAQWMEASLQAPSTAALLVSLPTEMAVQETLELYHTLSAEVRVDVAALLLNRFTPPLLLQEELQHPALSNHPTLLQLAKQQDSLAKESYNAFSQLSQLPPPTFKLPHVPSVQPTRNTLSALAACMKKMKGLL